MEIWLVVFGLEVNVKGIILKIVENFVIKIGWNCNCDVLIVVLVIDIFFVNNWLVNFIIKIEFLVVKLINIINLIWL